MNSRVPAPRRIGRWASLSILLQFPFNAIATMRRLHRDHGPFVLLTYPHSRRSRPEFLGVVADSGLYQTMFSDGGRWRNIKIAFRGFKNSASDRLTMGFTRLRGGRHAYYRRLIAKPLSRPAVAAMSSEMAETARRVVESWPRGETTDLNRLAENIMQGLAIGLLFGDDRERAQSIAKMIKLQFDAFQLLPLSWLCQTSKQERLIIEWIEEKTGNLNAKDILSILANNPDEQGSPADRELIAGILSFTFGAAFETCRNALAWTLIMLAQHPDIASKLVKEIQDALGGSTPTMDRLAGLQLLDGVVKESFRLFPPVPILARKTTMPTALGEAELPANTRVFVCAYLINRNPKIYPEPDRFRPERWRGFEPAPQDYAVFGLGGRTCPGFNFANQALKISLAIILSRFRLEILPNSRIDYISYVTLQPYPRVPVVLLPSGGMPRAARIIGRIHELVDLPQPA